MKGLILAGGSGTRLHPLTAAVSKQLLPVFNKPMIYYPLSALMLAGIRDILIISTPRDEPSFRALLGNGAGLGIHLSYAVQGRPAGIADAFVVGAEFIGHDHVALALGDNIFDGVGLAELLQSVARNPNGATIFAREVSNPHRYGVVEIGPDGGVVGIEEKPARARSNYAVPGLYFYDESVVEVASDLAPSARGELEITALHDSYRSQGQLHVRIMDGGITWLDAGTFDSLLEASRFVESAERTARGMVGAIEAVAFRQGFIDAEQLARLATNLPRNSYSERLLKIANGADE